MTAVIASMIGQITDSAGEAATAMSGGAEMVRQCRRYYQRAYAEARPRRPTSSTPCHERRHRDQGSPRVQIESAADWLRRQLAVEVGQAGNRLNDACRSAEDSWRCSAGKAFTSAVSDGVDRVDDLEGAARTMAEDLDSFVGKLRTCRQDMATVRTDPAAAGLTVDGFVVQDPGPGPVRPPDDFAGDEAEVQAHNQRVEEYDDHQDLIRAYEAASSEAARIDRVYGSECTKLQDDYTVGQHAAWLLTVGDVMGDTAAAAIGVHLGLRESGLTRRAQELLDEATRAVEELQAHPERYTTRRWFFFETLDEVRLEADRLAIEGRLDEAEDLVRQAQDVEHTRTGRLRLLARAGRVLGPLGVGVGVYNDYQEGESTTQIAVSQGGSLAAGALAGAGVGAAVGSVVPVAGTAVGAVVGTVVGAGVAIFADGAIDSLFENGPDLGEAAEEGLEALQETRETIVDGLSGAAETVGGWFS